MVCVHISANNKHKIQLVSHLWQKIVHGFLHGIERKVVRVDGPEERQY
jgi:hypothetical protein